MRRWLHELPCKFPECLPVQSRTPKTALLHIAADFRVFAENSLVYNHPPTESIEPVQDIIPIAIFLAIILQRNITL